MLRWDMRRILSTISRVFFGLRFRLMLLVLLACAPLVGLTVHTASRERRQELTAWRGRAWRFAQLAQGEEAELRKQARQQLLTVSKTPAVRSASLEACRKSLREFLELHPHYVNLAVVDPNGDLVASALPLSQIGPLGERTLVRRIVRNAVFTAGNYVSGIARGRPTVTFGCPVLDDSGRVQAVVFAWVGLEWFARPGSELSAPALDRAGWMMVDGKGIILASDSASGLAGGRPFPNSELVKTALSQRAGNLEALDWRGVPSFYAFESLDSQLLGGKAVMILGIPRQALFAQANRALIRDLGWIGIAAGLALALGWVGSTFLVMRPVEALVRASNRVATGDLSTRTGLRHGKDELGQLTRTFDQMAQALEQRESQRQLAEDTLDVRDHMIRELPLVPAAVCVCDQYGVVQLNNRAAVELWGCEPPDPHASRRFCGAYELFHADGTPMPHNESPMAEVLRTGVPLRNRELVIGRPNGTRVPVLASVVPLRDAEGAMIGAVGCLQDITDRKRAEEVLRESNEKLQQLSRRLVESQETERRHIARELHDEVGQTLTVAEMNLQAAMQSSRAASLSGRLNQSLQAVGRVLEQVRDLSLNLRPSMLDDLGLESALKWYTKRQATLSGLQAEFQTDVLEDRLDPIIETACFRVAQEALTNVVRHARARAVTLALRKQNGHLHLFVRDDGVGFDVAALRQHALEGASLGLLSMEERATLVAGGLELKSAPGQGTEVHAWFPLKWRTPDS